jgi:hypothetical protein
LCLAGRVEAYPFDPRLGIEVNEAAVDLAPRRPALERVNGRTEGRVGKDGAVDQHGLVDVAIGVVAGQGAGEERLAARPGFPALGQGGVELADLEGRKSAGEAGGGTRGER